jgi:UDP-glucose 6-dehydrogenase
MKMLQNTTDPEEVELIKYASNTLYAGSVDLTAKIAVFLTLYPEVQKAQQEIDGVVGKHRLPSMADRDRLPY